MTIDRREFVTTTGAAALVAILPLTRRRRLELGGLAAAGASTSPLPIGRTPDVTTLRDPRVKALALTAVEAARSAGATYADVRLTYTRRREFTSPALLDRVDLGLSVRALVDGYWGWAATPYIAESEAPRVAQTAVALAKGSAASRQVRHVELGTVPVVADGVWTTPLRLDPFEVAWPQVNDWVQGIGTYIKDLGGQRGDPSAGPQQTPYIVGVWCQRQERVFASTEGSYCTQTVTITAPNIGFHYQGEPVLLHITPAQTGYEYVTELPAHELIRQAMEYVDRWAQLPRRPLEIGRYDVIFGASAMATLVAKTFGIAAQVDRALGYEANAGGTSYLGPDPLTVLGTPVAAPLVTVTADRSTPKGLATVGWDDEGVVPEDFTMIKDGVLVDYQTTREQAQWLAPWYQKHGHPIRSHGCAAAPDALSIAMQHLPNLTLHPGKDPLGLEDLIASLDHGLLVERLEPFWDDNMMDFQQLNGLGLPASIIEVRHGKRVAQIGGHPGLLFQSPELWRNVFVLGGAGSAERLYHQRSIKGDPPQSVLHSVAAVPAVIKQLALIDATRRA